MKLEIKTSLSPQHACTRDGRPENRLFVTTYPITNFLAGVAPNTEAPAIIEENELTN